MLECCKFGRVHPDYFQRTAQCTWMTRDVKLDCLLRRVKLANVTANRESPPDRSAPISRFSIGIALPPFRFHTSRGDADIDPHLLNSTDMLVRVSLTFRLFKGPRGFNQYGFKSKICAKIVYHP